MTSRFRVRTALKTTSLLPLCYPGRKEKRLAFLQAVELFGCGDPQTNPSAQGQDCASAAPGGPRSRTRRSTWVGAFLWRLLSPCNPAAELRIKSPHSANWRHSAATQKLLDSSHPPMGILFPWVRILSCESSMTCDASQSHAQSVPVTVSSHPRTVGDRSDITVHMA